MLINNTKTKRNTKYSRKICGIKDYINVAHMLLPFACFSLSLLVKVGFSKAQEFTYPLPSSFKT